MFDFLENGFWIDLNLGFDGRAVDVCLDVLYERGGEIMVFIVLVAHPCKAPECLRKLSLLVYLQRNDNRSNAGVAATT